MHPQNAKGSAALRRLAIKIAVVALQLRIYKVWMSLKALDAPTRYLMRLDIWNGSCPYMFPKGGAQDSAQKPQIPPKWKSKDFMSFSHTRSRFM